MAKQKAKTDMTDDLLDNLAIEVSDLKDEIKVFRTVMDEIREDLEWLVRNLRIADVPRPIQLTSMPVDPCADDFHERVNAVSRDDLPDEVSTHGQSNEAPQHEEGREDARQPSQTSTQKGRQQSFLDSDSADTSPSTS